MKRPILHFALATVLIAAISGCSFLKKDEEGPTGKVPRDVPVLTEVEVFDLLSANPEINFSKSGTVTPKIEAFVSPQVVGNITRLDAKVGMSVRKGDLLAVLGDSISTEMSDLQRNSAGDALDLTGQIVDENYVLQQNQLNGAELGVQTAWVNYQHALEAKREARDVFELQVDSADLNVDRASDAYEDLNDDYDELSDDIDDLEERIDELDSDDESKASLEVQLEAMKEQLGQLDKAIEGADDGISQSENAVELIEEGYDSQLNQMNTAIDMALKQYQSAVNQYNSAGTGAQLQGLSSDLQLLQAQSAYNSAQLSADSKNITSPIAGVISEVSVKQSNLVAPGQVIFKIENPDEMSVKTAVALDEVKFLHMNDEVKLVSGDKEARGRIISISPVLNDMTHKIDMEIEVIDKGVFVSGELVKVKYLLARNVGLFVPLISVDVDGDKQFVKVVDVNGKVSFKPVKMGQVFGNYVEILSGLRGNEAVISSPSSFVEEGERVKVKAEKIAR